MNSVMMLNILFYDNCYTTIFLLLHYIRSPFHSTLFNLSLRWSSTNLTDSIQGIYVYACPNHTDDGIRLDHGYLEGSAFVLERTRKHGLEGNGLPNRA